jgi:cytidine deaminase
MNRDRLLAQARAAATRAYAPYSHFQVGAAVVVVDDDGSTRVVTGANVENASYGLTLCAERTALAAALTSQSLSPRAPLKSALSSGPQTRPRITHVAVSHLNASDDAGPAQHTPCGACRQWLAELAPDAVYYIEGVPGAFHLDDMLPLAFRLGTPAGGHTDA